MTTTPTLTVHHLRVSQSERIVWLCEEAGIPYNLQLYNRAPLLAPASYKALHPTGTAPVVTDKDVDGTTDVTVAETMAVVQFLLGKYEATHPEGIKALTVAPGEKGWTDYLFWTNFANGTLQPSYMTMMWPRWLGVGASDGSSSKINDTLGERWNKSLQQVENHLKNNAYLVGDKFTVADIVTVFTLTTCRKFGNVSLEGYPNVLAYLGRIGEREGYKRAMAKAEPDMEPVLGAQVPE